jgi:sugar transferase (PEP-CTERM system associated)
MIRLFNHYFRRQILMQVLCDLSLISIVFFGTYWFLVRQSTDHAVPATHGLSLLTGLFLINTASGLYRPTRGRSLIQARARAALALVLALVLSYAVFDLLPPEVGSNEELKWLTILCVAGVVAHRVYAGLGKQATKPQSRILIFGAGASAQLVARSIALANPQVRIVGFIPGPNESQSIVDASQVLSGPGSLKDQAIALGVDEIVVAVSDRRGGAMPLRELLDCKIFGVQVSDLSTYFEKMLGQIRIDQLHAGWLIFGNGFDRGVYRDYAKRLFDILWSFVLLALAAPLLIITAVSIVLESKGPIFYRQERVGQDGRTFSVLKFRSMRVDAEKNGAPQWAVAKDDRVTRIGSLIRRFRIDEFPQLLNVLKGEMSLVGPRPERPFFVNQLTADIPFYAVRHSVKPGVTGWAQVRYQYGASVEDSLQKLQYDLYYVKNHSLFLDIVVLFETVGVVLSGKGAR